MPDIRGYRCSMIVNPRITNPSIPKHRDMMDIVIPSSISLVPEPVKGLLKTFDPTRFALTLRHCGSPSFCLTSIFGRGGFRGANRDGKRSVKGANG
jgi:hypothetical protein